MTQMSSVDGTALHSLTLSSIKAFNKTGKKGTVSALKDVNLFSRDIMKGKKQKLGIRESKLSTKKLIGDSKKSKRDKRSTATDCEHMYEQFLRQDLLFPSEGNDFGIPDLLPGMLWKDTSLLPERTFARRNETLLSTMYYCHGSRPFDGENHMKPVGGFMGFFTEDKQFMGLYQRAAHWAERFQSEKWHAIIEPDYSTYWDWPFALRLWSVYRSRWCARYWQQLSMKVIPLLRRTNDLERDKWLYDSLPSSTPIAAMQLRMGGKTNQSDPNYWSGISEVLHYMVDNKGLESVLFYAGESLEKYVVGHVPDDLEYRMINPYINERTRQLRESKK
jgi:hypothetical protein